jgi:V/A-type H+-transporting ATPase subunit K
MKNAKRMMAVMLGLGVILLVISLVSFAKAEVAASPEIAGVAKDPSAAKWGYIAAALVTGMSSIGAGLAVGYVGSAAVGAISEKPEMTGKALIYVGLAEGIAIYGLIIAIMILSRV